MTCSICNGKIEKQLDQDGKVVWEKGHNAEPINNGRCCDKCNEKVVIVERVRELIRE